MLCIFELLFYLSQVVFLGQWHVWTMIKSEFHGVSTLIADSCKHYTQHTIFLSQFNFVKQKEIYDNQMSRHHLFIKLFVAFFYWLEHLQITSNVAVNLPFLLNSLFSGKFIDASTK